MKLQPKHAVNNALAEERRVQIDEGLRLARKIDGLRETLASLETQHQNFLEGMGRELDQATREKSLHLDRLRGEINVLEERRKKLLEPVDIEWTELKEAKSEHQKALDNLITSQENLDQRETKVGLSEKDVQKRLEYVGYREEETLKVSRQTNELYQNVKTLKEKISNDYLALQEEIQKKSAEFEEREKALINHANINEHRKGVLDQRERQLNEKERQVNDRYQTLLRTLNRVKK